ncbi:MAG: endonuclease/exonuclease/phosphatase family protein [Myxococcota bacterium]
MSALRQLASRLWYLPDAEEPVLPSGSGRPLARGERFTVVSWNVQFCAGRNHWFFYDGGPDVHASPAEVEDTLAGVIALLRSQEADLVLLQEVDVASRRTGFVDQHGAIARALGLPCVASTPYFKVPFVPVPPASPLGPVDTHLTVYSRFQLDPGVRVALSRLDEPVWRRLFNLRRALLHLPMPLDDGTHAHLFHTHLSAFSRGDGTLAKQVGTVGDRMRATTGPALLAGDLNSLPPGDEPARLGFASILYADARSPIRPLWDELDVLFPPLDAEGRAGSDGYSYVPWGANRADRTIDYAFGREVVVHAAEALTEGARWSDHLPVRLELSLR